MANLELSGFIRAGGDGCGCSSGGSVVEKLALLCGQAVYQSIIDTPSGAPLRLDTTGAVGDEFVDIDMLSGFTSLEFLYLKSNAPMAIRIGAAPARVTSSALVAPVVFTGGETFLVTIDGTVVSTTFLAGGLTLAAIANLINASAAGLGLATPRITVSGTALVIEGTETHYDALTGEGAVVIGAGTGNALLGFSTAQAGYAAGEDVTFSGSAMFEFQRYPYAPARIQASGQASVTILAAGRTSP